MRGAVVQYDVDVGAFVDDRVDLVAEGGEECCGSSGRWRSAGQVVAAWPRSLLVRVTPTMRTSLARCGVWPV